MAISRARIEARVYIDAACRLPLVLSRLSSKSPALELQHDKLGQRSQQLARTELVLAGTDVHCENMAAA